jgi:1,4-dihydroxy-2-naphthoate octaprenyltransferase
MADTRTGHWKIFNALGKFIGVCFIFGGVVVLIFGAAQRDWLIGVPGLVVAVLGILLTLARPYRPDLKE